MPVASMFAKTLRECVNIWRTAVTFDYDVIKDKYQYVGWVKYNLFLKKTASPHVDPGAKRLKTDEDNADCAGMENGAFGSVAW